MQTVMSLKPGGYYHIFDRGVDRESIFFEERNYLRFLDLFGHHITPVAEIFAYCLLRNHFHFLVRIRVEPQIQPPAASKAFNNLLTAYAKSINKVYGRTGPLFQHHFGRIPISTDRYLSSLVRYIHNNPCKHGFVKNFQDWPFSSYHELASRAFTPLARPKVLEWFGNVGGFRNSHNHELNEHDLLPVIGKDMD
jgi:putative transposase